VRRRRGEKKNEKKNNRGQRSLEKKSETVGRRDRMEGEREEGEQTALFVSCVQY
jgi:hypothetical protein